MIINDFYESYVITKNYESRKKFRFCLELNEMPSNAIGLRITFINWSIQEFIQIYGQTANLWWFVRNRQRFYKMQRPLNQCSKNLPTASFSKIYSKKPGLDLQLIANHPGVKFEEYFFTSLVQWFFLLNSWYDKNNQKKSFFVYQPPSKKGRLSQPKTGIYGQFQK